MECKIYLAALPDGVLLPRHWPRGPDGDEKAMVFGNLLNKAVKKPLKL